MSDRIWDLPAPRSVCEVHMEDGSLIILRRHGNPKGPRIVMSHGNGLAIDLYYPFWSLLAHDFDLIIFDLRNHGWNPRSSLRNHNLPAMTSDHVQVLDAVDSHFGKGPKIGVFHSVAALTLVLSSDAASKYAGLFLFDPPICRRAKTYADFEAAAQRAAKMASVRTVRFRSVAELVELLHYSPVFRHVVPGVRDLVARTILRKQADGSGYELCCPPDYESQINIYAWNFSVLVDLDEIRCPVKVLGADPTVPYSYLPSFDLSDIAKVDYDFLPGSTHFLQLEEPEACAAAVRGFVRQHKLGLP